MKHLDKLHGVENYTKSKPAGEGLGYFDIADIKFTVIKEANKRVKTFIQD